MSRINTIPKILSEVSLDDLQRIDAALEGDWNATVVTIWSAKEGRLSFSEIVRNHSTYKPSLELYFHTTWLGIHCYTRQNGQNVFDETLAKEIITYIEEQLKTKSPFKNISM